MYGKSLVTNSTHAFCIKVEKLLDYEEYVYLDISYFKINSLEAASCDSRVGIVG